MEKGVLQVKKTLIVILSIAILTLTAGLFSLGGGGAGDGQPPAAGGTPAKGVPVTGTIFTDVSPDHWAYADLMYLVERGIITGLPGGQYRGAEPLDRYSAAALIARAIRYMQHSPEIVTAQDLNVLKDLIFKMSDNLSTLQAQLGTIEGADTAALESRIAGNEQSIAQLRAQAQATNGVADEPVNLPNRVNANFIISLTALLVGVIAVALATMGL